MIEVAEHVVKGAILKRQYDDVIDRCHARLPSRTRQRRKNVTRDEGLPPTGTVLRASGRASTEDLPTRGSVDRESRSEPQDRLGRGSLMCARVSRTRASSAS